MHEESTWFISKKNLKLINYSEATGFTYQNLIFDTLLDFTDTSLPDEKAIQTDFDAVITWTICTGWIVVPFKNGELNPILYLPLVDFLKQEALSHKLSDAEPTTTSRELLLNEYINSLQEDLHALQQHVNGRIQLSCEDLVALAKEYRTTNVDTIDTIIATIENELTQFYHLKQKLKRTGDYALVI